MTKMMKLGVAVFGLAISSGVAFAGPQEDMSKKVKELEKKIVDQGIYVETAKKGIKLSGYVNAGYSYNFNGGGTDEGVNGSPGSIRTHFNYNDSGDFSVDQVKVVFEKSLEDANTWTAGFRIDLLGGESGKYVAGADNEWGMENLGIEQAYVTFRVPVGNGLDFKLGKFVTPMGYEVIETPANLNVTRGYIFNALPFTHTGLMATYKFNDNWDLSFAYVNGVNNSDSNYLGSRYNYEYTYKYEWTGNGYSYAGEESDSWYGASADWAGAFLARVGYTSDRFSTAFSALFAPEGDATIGGGEENAPFLLLDWWMQFKVNDNFIIALDAVFGKSWDTENFSQYNYRYEYSGGPYDDEYSYVSGYDNNDPVNSDQFWGVAVYAKYQFNKVFSLAGRAEYFHSEDGRALGIYDSDPAKDPYTYADSDEYDRIPKNWNLGTTHSDLYSFTLTAGFDVWENLLMRLEYRLDVTSAAGEDYKYHHDDNGNSYRVEEDNIFTNNRAFQSTIVFDVSYSF
jgi:hypothetical protein